MALVTGSLAFGHPSGGDGSGHDHQDSQPPATPREPVTETLHGRTLTDAYRWLEGDEKGNVTEAVADWTDAQNAHTRDVLDHLPGRDKLDARLMELMEVPSISSPTMRADRYFYYERSGKQNQAVIKMRIGYDGEPRVLLDPNALSEDGLLTISWIEPSPDGKLLAFGMYRSGDENSTCYVLDVDDNKWLADEIPGKVGGVDWLPDARSFLYRRLADISNPYSGQIKLHELGTHHRQDALLFEQYKEGPLATTWGPGAWLSRDGRWLMLAYWTSTKSNDLWAVDLDHWRRTGEFNKRDILVGEQASSSGTVIGDTLFMETDYEAPNGRVIAVDLNNPAPDRWREVIPESDDMVLRNLSVARGILVGTYLHNASTRIEKFDYQGNSLGAVKLPGIGSAGISTAEDRTEAFLSFSSFNMPSSIYRLDLRDDVDEGEGEGEGERERELWARPDVPVDPDTVEVRQVWYPSKDGTKVSMFIIHKKGIELDGSNPTILYGYGGFNISLTPSFSATLFPWFEAGGVYAVANLRGGGEYGKAWHEAGMLDHKQNVFDDFIAAAEWLIDNKYTSRRRLGIAGGSNGGLLTGAAITQRPELFEAALVAVPLLDMIRYHQFLMARYWVPEYGSSEDASQFAYLLKYSPYHRIDPSKRYPAVLLTAGENDTRVHPLHARKMAAELQAVAASQRASNPVLLWVDRDAGHGAGKPLRLRVRDVGDQRIFMMWRLGMLERE